MPRRWIPLRLPPGPGVALPASGSRKHIYFTAPAWEEEHGRRIAERLDSLGLTYEVMKANRLPKLGGSTTRETYQKAKNTLAVVTAPPSAMKADTDPTLGRLAVSFS